MLKLFSLHVCFSISRGFFLNRKPVSGHTLMCFVLLIFLLLNLYLCLGYHSPILNKMCFIVIFAKVLPSLAICSSPVHALSHAIPVPAEKPHSESCISDKPHSSTSSLSMVAHWSWSPHLSTSKIFPSTFSSDIAKKEMLGVTLRELQQLPMQKILPILINQALYKCPLFLAINGSRRCILRQKKPNQTKPVHPPLLPSPL